MLLWGTKIRQERFQAQLCSIQMGNPGISNVNRLLLLLVCFFVAHPAVAVARQPNIIIILVDDMGFSDIGAYGGEIKTPHIDSLAQGGGTFFSIL
jgi:hypothetical protein